MKKMKQILVPFAVVAVGVLGAFATQMSDKNDVVLQTMKPGWTDHVAPCSQNETLCLVSGAYACTIIVDNVKMQLKGKRNINDATCPVLLFQSENPNPDN